jgi:hypothetical protein
MESVFGNTFGDKQAHAEFGPWSGLSGPDTIRVEEVVEQKDGFPSLVVSDIRPYDKAQPTVSDFLDHMRSSNTLEEKGFVHTETGIQELGSKLDEPQTPRGKSFDINSVVSSLVKLDSCT